LDEEEYITKVTHIILPIEKDTVCNWNIGSGLITQNGTAYIDNKEYNTTDGNPYLNVLSRVHNPEGYVSYNTSPYTGFIYFRKDHLGNIREVWHAASNKTIQVTQYYPSGLPWATTPADNLSTQPYKYNGKEFVEMSGYDGLDYGARTYFVDRNGWGSVDPLAEKYPNISPYAYCAGNPVNAVDPDGMDWIYSTDDKKYSWRDDINAKSKMPEGYQYVGAKNNDILTHMGVSNKYETKTDNNTGIGAVSGDNKGPAGEGILGATSSDVKADIRIDTNVSNNKKNITDNNKSGKTFNGVTVTAYVSERGASSSDDLTSNSYGVLSVSQGRKEYTAGLFEPKGSYLSETGTAATTASIQIPASGITPTNYLKSATVTIGSPNPGLIYSTPTTITFSLQTRTYFRPSNK